ncbi:hypothetical protein BX600DRAFT_430920 [Xylariales sp. PMI_506]|nr:hypothetical protein BX600DRAFT_430920 [Xylariales sp. PMI_506]
MSSLWRGLLARTRISRPGASRAVAATAPRCCFSAATISHPANRVQVYVSASRDPYLNLSIEHYLLQKSTPESLVLLLYTNRPCVVIGRNQNPWLEVNLALLDRPGLLAGGRGGGGEDESGSGYGEDRGVALVRRRSGGGAVFHDSGNVNYSVICPPVMFDRDRHAEMVVRALRGLGATTTRVNARHDIVVDLVGGHRPSGGAAGSGAHPETYKISGSAYKLTRQRSLHHGTCLLSTPNLDRLGRFLRSPAAPWMTARGVESVRSPVTNVGLGNREFEDAVIAEFGAMYGDVDAEVVTEADAWALPEIEKGYAELTSDEWRYLQTPLFTFSTHPTEKDDRERPPLPQSLPPSFEAFIEARQGKITSAQISGADPDALADVELHKVKDWSTLAPGPGGEWLNEMFGVGLRA